MVLNCLIYKRDLVMKIGDISDRLGLSRDTLRFYEKIGLLKAERSNSGIRDYTEANVNRLKLIICFKESGIPLVDIRAYLALVDKGPGNEDERLAILLRSKARLEDNLKKIQRSLEMLNAFKIEFAKKKIESPSIGYSTIEYTVKSPTTSGFLFLLVGIKANMYLLKSITFHANKSLDLFNASANFVLASKMVGV